MPRDNDKNNDSRGRRDRPGGGRADDGKGRAGGGKGRSGAARGPEKKFAKRGFAGNSDGEGKPYAGKSDGPRSYAKKPYARAGKPYAGKRDGDAPRPARFNRDDRSGGGGEKRPYTPRGDRPQGDRPYSARPSRDGDHPRGDRPERKFGGDKKFSRGAPRDRDAGPGDRGPRRDFGGRSDRGSDRGDLKPWQKRDAGSPDHAGRNSRPPRDGARNFDRPRGDHPQGDRPFRERPKFDRPREGRDERPRADRPRFDRPREGGSSWQEHPRSDSRSERPRRDNEDDSKVFAKRP